MKVTTGKSRRGFSKVIAAMATTIPSMEYVAAHAFLPPNPAAVPQAELQRRSARLSDPKVSRDEKRATLVLLAHHGSEGAVTLCAEYAGNPDPDLSLFSKLALEEAAFWAGMPAPVPPRGTCPCGSRRPYVDCCGAANAQEDAG
jgi:hypothetical protein